MVAKTKLISIIAFASIALLAVGCDNQWKQQEEIKQNINVIKSDATDFVQTGYTKIYNPNGSDTQLITLYDKKTGVEYIMLRNSDMTSIQPRTASDGGVLLHTAEEK